MSPLLLLIVIVAGLIAMVPVWRLRIAGWPRRWLVVAWLVYAVGILAAVRAPAATRFMLPILVLAFGALVAAGPERLTRVLRGRGEPPRPIVNVTPMPPASLPAGNPGKPGDPGAGDPDVSADDADGDR